MKWYTVSYASAGCLPDSEPLIFGELDDAAEYVHDEWIEVATEAGIIDNIKAGDLPYPTTIAESMGIDDPRPDSLYSWSIERYYGEV